jgi:hypothetical protein
MTFDQQATIAFLAQVIRTGDFRRSFNVRVTRSDRPSDYVWAIEGEFHASQLSLTVRPRGDRVYKDTLEFASNGTVRVKVEYHEDKANVRLDFSVHPKASGFEGRKDSRNFRGRFDGTDTIKLTNPAQGDREFTYRVEL